MLSVVAVMLLAATVGFSSPASAVTLDVASCKIPSPFSLLHSGIPRAENTVDSTGTYRAVVLFADFPDRPNTETTEETWDRLWQQETQDFLQRQSRQRLEFDVQPHHQWLRLSTDYQATPFNPTAEIVALADDAVDFTDADAVWVVYERTAELEFGFAWAAPFQYPELVVEDGQVRIGNGIVLGTSRAGPQTADFDLVDAYVAHEILHTFGLPDLSNVSATPHRWSYVGNFDPMGNIVGFAGGRTSFDRSANNGGELLAWHRWQLGWADDDQVLCTDAVDPVTVTLEPLMTWQGVQSVVVPLGATEALVVESRIAQRYDRDLENEGALVYVVDTAKFTADGSIQVQNAVSGTFPSANDLLAPGETLRTRGITVGVTERIGNTMAVQVFRTRCNDQPITIDMTLGASGIGTEGDDVILGTNGADIIDGRGGNDTICAGDGADTVVGGTGDDWIDGAAGADLIRGNQGSDTILGGLGADRLFGGVDADVLMGQNGDDVIGGFGGSDEIYGGSGADTIFGGFGADQIDGGPGADEVRGLAGDDLILGGNGADMLFGDRGQDRIEGGADDDMIFGGNASDDLRGDGGDDELHGGKGDDDLDGGGGADQCFGNLELIADVATGTCELIGSVP